MATSRRVIASVNHTDARPGTRPMSQPNCDLVLPFRHAVPTTPTDQDGCARRLLPRLHGLPRNSGGSASATSLARPAQASLTLRPVGLLNRPRRPLSRGFGPVGCPSEPLVSYQRNRHLAGWNLPPLVNRAVWAHRVFRVDGRSLRPKARDRTNSSRPSRPTSAPARG